MGWFFLIKGGNNMNHDLDKNAYKPINVGITIFVVGVIAGWIFNLLDFKKVAMAFYGMAILAFCYGMIHLQRLINKSIDDKFKNDGK